MIGNGIDTYSDKTLKSMNKDTLIEFIRILESNLRGANETNDIQYHNCLKLLKEERNKTIDEFAKKSNEKITEFILQHQKRLDFVSGVSVAWHIIDEIAESMKGDK